MAYLQQTYKGIDVYNAITVVAFKTKQVYLFSRVTYRH